MSNNEENLNVSSSSSSSHGRGEDNHHIQQLAGANALPNNFVVS